MKSFIPWVGGKSKLLWLIRKLSPSRYSRFIDVFGGSGTVTLSRPIQPGCIEVYNDFNSDLTNLFCCVKNRTMALLLELGFLPLNTRDDFNVLYELSRQPEVTQCYEIWNQIRDELNECYGSRTPREHLPLSQQKEFRRIKNDIIREAENIRLGLPTFEDEALQDEPEPEEAQEEHQSYSVFEQAQRYRAAKSVLQDVYALDEEHAEAVRELEQLWAEGYTVAAHQLGKFYRDDLSTMRDHEKAERWFRYKNAHTA